jgi:outer membrane protein assembly factor BamE (lipoprotein component of BamABCDE complex)
MPFAPAIRRTFPIVAALLLGVSLSACGSGLSLTQSKARGYEISEDALADLPGRAPSWLRYWVRPATNNFGTETAWYYIGEKVQQTAFGMELSKERTVLAVYFDKNGKVLDTERLGVKDGRCSLWTPPYHRTGRTDHQSIISSFDFGSLRCHALVVRKLTMRATARLGTCPWFDKLTMRAAARLAPRGPQAHMRADGPDKAAHSHSVFGHCLRGPHPELVEGRVRSYSVASS